MSYLPVFGTKADERIDKLNKEIRELTARLASHERLAVKGIYYTMDELDHAVRLKQAQAVAEFKRKERTRVPCRVCNIEHNNQSSSSLCQTCGAMAHLKSLGIEQRIDSISSNELEYAFSKTNGGCIIKLHKWLVDWNHIVKGETE